MKQTGYFVAPGFSGAPVWDEQLDGVAGIVVAAEIQQNIRAAFMIPADVLVKAWPEQLGESPFKGLEYFTEADADIFFGRESLAAQLAGRLREDSFLGVVGASGSGKSSVVRAGLVPALKRGEPLVDGTLPPSGSARWLPRVFTPTTNPLKALAFILTDDLPAEETLRLQDDLAKDARILDIAVHKFLSRRRGERLLPVVDQFEDLFDPRVGEVDRKAFVDNLLMAAAPATAGPTIVVIALRADFYPHCARYANLREALAKHQEYIGPMREDELRRAIEEPAKRGGWELASGLVDVILRDVGFIPGLVEMGALERRLADSSAHDKGEPGALPLLSHALLETWKRRRGRMLTLEGYTESGGVHGAIAKSAETVYTKLSAEERKIAESIFPRLTELGEVGTPDTRRRTPLSELIPRPEDKPSVESVINKLADARLITTEWDRATERDTVEVAHEALIREWPTLRDWLNQNRESLRLHRHLTEAAREWAKLGRDPDELYHGARLAQALEWAEAHPDDLNELEREFLDASKKSAERTTRRLRLLVAGLAAALIVAGVLAVVAFVFAGRASQNAQDAVANASTAQAAEARALAQQANAEAASTQAVSQGATAVAAQATAQQDELIANSQRLAFAAQSLLEDAPETAVLLAQEAILQNKNPLTNEALQALYDALERHPWRPPLLQGHTGPVQSAVFSPDGERILTAYADGTAILWDLGGHVLVTFEGHVGEVIVDP